MKRHHKKHDIITKCFIFHNVEQKYCLTPAIYKLVFMIRDQSGPINMIKSESVNGIQVLSSYFCLITNDVSFTSRLSERTLIIIFGHTCMGFSYQEV